MNKLVLIVLIPSLAFALDPAQPVARVVNGQVLTTHIELPNHYAGVYPYHSASYRWAADGWAQLIPCPQVAESNIVGRTYAISGDVVTEICQYENAADAQAAQEYQLSLPVYMPAIEVSAIILTATNGSAYRYIVAADGSLLGGLLDHASPRPPQSVIDAQDRAARAAHDAARTALNAKLGTNSVGSALGGIKNAAASAGNSLPALRQAVADLAEMVRLLQEAK